ncbi:NAD(P)-binding Rossmann-fold containing protein [Glarea lozoyensis ATCC 20868]|uniref:NAD(P)-binding Rossmann-fold containing protein n=1 Tax=Glarea lozoyensis (strain ATCC 20868 / MF5171) TaxID=1116229 RepID=S3CYI5_GLAL2|nr:NAD(P)-binding Rossmann-fold containing protein [Glarea lozoyensis ATCC 20868]EPE30014.1 NAD(P)-binding Rossmann-fold containing protein [Glarea lozoyensis ATCC 20868]
MCSLAANRRSRGLNASAVNGGAIIGAGYITRETDRALDITVEKMALMHLSEEDFHQMIAEAIESGHSGSPHSPEITTGLLDISSDSPHIPKWYSNPKFARFIVNRAANEEDRKGRTATVTIHDHLGNCKTKKDLFQLVGKSFGDQVRKLLQLSEAVTIDEILSKRALELGIDSLVSVDIRHWVLKNFLVSIPVLRLMGNDTLNSFVQIVVEGIPAEMLPVMHTSTVDRMSETTSSTTVSVPSTLSTEQCSPSINTEFIDWEAESNIPEDLRCIKTVYGSSPAVPPKNLVLIGATGLLGRHLLESLLRETSTEVVHCLAVRNLASRTVDELVADERIKYYHGNLSDPLLGLSKEEAESIFAKADAVIHNGADTSHIKSFHDLRSSNVGSTIELTRMCLPRKIPMHYISSVGVAIYSDKNPFPPVSVAGNGSISPAADGSFGYGSSKWTNERFLERVQEHHALPICIYRPSTIIREGVHSRTTRAKLDWVNSLLYYIRKTKTAPRIVNAHGAFDLVRAETCCADVVRHLSKGEPGKSQMLRYVNQVGDQVIPMNEISLVDSERGECYELLDLDEWIREAV